MEGYWIKESEHQFSCIIGKLENTEEGSEAKIIVTFDPDCIRFYLDNNWMQTPQYPREIRFYSISLQHPKITGNDLLDLSRNINLPDSLPQELKLHINLSPELYPDFPCIQTEKPKEEELHVKMKVFILNFISELEKEENTFNKSETVIRCKKKLHKSIVYRLITAKLHYYNYIFNNRIAKDAHSYNKITNQYTELLLERKLNSILPHNKVGKDSLFHEPEYELQKIMQYSRHLRKRQENYWTKTLSGIIIGLLLTGVIYIVSQMYDLLPILWLCPPIFILSILLFQIPNVAKTCKLASTPRTKIQNFFFLKHSIITSYYTDIGKWIFIFCSSLMAIWSIAAIYAGIYFSEDNLFTKEWFYYAALMILILFIINAAFNRNRNSFLPRILIALIAIWFTVAVNDDYVVSMIDIRSNESLIALIATIITISIILLYEIAERSPYYMSRRSFYLMGKECNTKLLPILSFSFFFSILIGIGIQFITFPGLIKSSNILPTVTFNKELSEIEYLKYRTQYLIDNVEFLKSEINTFKILKEVNETRAHSYEMKNEKNTTKNTPIDTDFSLVKNRLDNIRHLSENTSLLTDSEKMFQHLISSLRNLNPKHIYNNYNPGILDTLLLSLHHDIKEINTFSTLYFNTDSLKK
ncbi:MAG: hypothetical protein LUH04_11990 [Clostridium sp.]|nr:hypothetical protein [Clostridium sp.]